MERRRGGAAGVGPDAAPCASREPRQAVGGARRRPLQNSQRVLLAKPHEGERTTGAMGRGQSRAPRRWRGGAMGTSRPTAMPHGGSARG